MRVIAKRHAWQILLGLLFVLMIMIGSKGTALADVNVGDKIDTTNWQKIQGLVPEAVLDYVKKRLALHEDRQTQLRTRGCLVHPGR